MTTGDGQGAATPLSLRGLPAAQQGRDAVAGRVTRSPGEVLATSAAVCRSPMIAWSAIEGSSAIGLFSRCTSSVPRQAPSGMALLAGGNVAHSRAPTSHRQHPRQGEMSAAGREDDHGAGGR